MLDFIGNCFKGWRTTLIGILIFCGAYHSVFITGIMEFLYGGAVAFGSSILLLFAPDKVLTFLKRKSRNL